MTNTTDNQHLSVGRNVKIGFFHLGSGMADIMTTGIWNRIMISDLGFAATPVGLLVSLRYFLAPLGVWAGRMSDRYRVGGYRRLSWVWLGRLMMMLSVFMLGWQTAELARGDEATFMSWTVLAFALLLFSLGAAISGSTFLALIYDRSPAQQRGRAVGIVWTFLLLGYTVGGILFGLMLPADKTELHHLFFVPDYAPDTFGVGLSFSPDTLQNLFIIGGLILGALWFFSLLGEERRIRNGRGIIAQAPKTGTEPQTSLRKDLALVWRNRSMRFFFWYLALSMLFAFSQDLVLEPFAGEVFRMDASHTTRFSAYWGSMAILGTLGFLWLSRKYARLTNTVMSRWGVILLVAAFLTFALSSFAEIRPLVKPGLVLLGLGLGIWNVGTLGLMMDMSPAGRAGTFLGFWSLVVTFARGLGVSSGGIVRDVALSMSSSITISYGAVFLIGAVGLWVSWMALNQVGMPEKQSRGDTAAVFAGALD